MCKLFNKTLETVVGAIAVAIVFAVAAELIAPLFEDDPVPSYSAWYCDATIPIAECPRENVRSVSKYEGEWIELTNGFFFMEVKSENVGPLVDFEFGCFVREVGRGVSHVVSWYVHNWWQCPGVESDLGVPIGPPIEDFFIRATNTNAFDIIYECATAGSEKPRRSKNGQFCIGKRDEHGKRLNGRSGSGPITKFRIFIERKGFLERLLT